MKKSILLLAVTMCSLMSFSQEQLEINILKSDIKWTADYAFYFNGHNGIVTFKEGYFIKTNEVITGGEFIIDMDTIKNLDIENEEGKEGLVDHLKNEDFFDVKKFPIAKLVISHVKYHDNKHMKIYANLTIKGVTNPVDFQAEVDYEKAQMITKFKIDRTRWNINYNSKEIEGKLKDGIISDAIGFEVKLSL
ncbi:MAG: YceI family protein [Flaviramulus sp.]|nr:YceI family protein [Flaviramulus sp.]